MRLASSLFQQVRHVQFFGPFLQVGVIERAFLNFEDAQHVAPLLVRDTTSLAIPNKLGEDCILGRLDMGRIVRRGLKRFPCPPFQGFPLESARAGHEQIHFECGFQMDDIEGTARLNRALDLSTVNVKIRREGLYDVVDAGL